MTARGRDNYINFHNKIDKQAGAELCQAQLQLGMIGQMILVVVDDHGGGGDRSEQFN